MQYLQLILESNSNKKLDAFAKEIIHAIRCSGAVKAGPIPYKGKRIIYCYNPTSITFNRLIAIKKVKGLNVTVNSLNKS